MRTFVAIPIPREGPGRRFLESCQGRLKTAGGDVRWTTPEQWHITLRFVGETTDELRRRLENAIQEIASMHEPFEVRVEGWGVFPPRGAPRVLWAGAQASKWPHEGFQGSWIEALRGHLDWALRDARWDHREWFRPHVTLARAKPPKDIGPLLNVLRNEQPPPGATFTATRITLFESELSPRGSIYTPLLEATLGT